MNIVLLSGGSGKRLWPLSNDIRSKQFIKIFKNAQGENESMVQRVYSQIRNTDPDAYITVATSKTQVSAIHNQLGGAVGVCVEPCRRDTFPAIALATAYLHDIKGISPDDAYASSMEKGSLGKTEMWYVLDASKDATLVNGFHHDMTKDQLYRSLQNGTVEKYLQKVPVHKDDVFYLPAGTVHAIGAGALIAEVQQSSNLTYRMHDYDRIDKQGKKRPLHLEKAMDVANLKGSNSPRQPMRILKYTRGCASEFLCRCKYFQVERLLLNTEQCPKMADIQSPVNTFQVFLCTGGCGVLFGSESVINFCKGDCIFLPADSIPLKLHGKAQFLRVSC